MPLTILHRGSPTLRGSKHEGMRTKRFVRLLTCSPEETSLGPRRFDKLVPQATPAINLLSTTDDNSAGVLLSTFQEFLSLQSLPACPTCVWIAVHTFQRCFPWPLRPDSTSLFRKLPLLDPRTITVFIQITQLCQRQHLARLMVSGHLPSSSSSKIFGERAAGDLIFLMRLFFILVLNLAATRASICASLPARHSAPVDSWTLSSGPGQDKHDRSKQP